MKNAERFIPTVLSIIVGCFILAFGQYRNIALNPNDVRAPGHGFPHASSNSEYSCIYPQDTTGGNHCSPDTTFLALSAINGDTFNTSHGSLYYASWGPQLHVPGLYWKIDFGHNVSVDKVKLWLRADWAGIPSHDSYWKRATLVFSDNSRDTIHVDSVKSGQEFSFASRTVTSLSITDLVPSDSTKWCAFTEVQVWGYDPSTSATPPSARTALCGAATPRMLLVVPGVTSSLLRVPDKIDRIELYSVLGKKIWECRCAGGCTVTTPSRLPQGVFQLRFDTQGQ